MTDAHKFYDLALHDHDRLPVIAYGSAGTGKTYGAVGAAVKWLEQDKRKRVVVTRPNVSFAKENGFIPGTQREKMAPWIRPIEQNFHMHGVDEGKLATLEKYKRLEYVALEHIQGLTWHDTFIIVDEVQNMSIEQLYVFLTRQGQYSKVVLCGDIAQTSPKFKQSGLAELLAMVEATGIRCHTVCFGPDDILRSKEAKEWIKAFETWERIKHG